MPVFNEQGTIDKSRNGRFRVLKKGLYADDVRPVVSIETRRFLNDNSVNSSSVPLTFEQVKVVIMEEVIRLYTPQDLNVLEPVQSAVPGNSENLLA